MNITKENIDALNAVIKVTIEETDYLEKVNNALKDYKKKASFKGFRPGKVPMGMIQKMYRKPVLAEEINKLVSDSLLGYIYDEKLDILGEPLPSESIPSKVDFENGKDFEFNFDIALSPAVDFKLSNKDKVPFYKIKIDDEIRNDYVSGYRKQFGQFKSIDKVEKLDELLKGNLVQLNENDEILEGGIFVEGVSLSIEMVKDQEIKDGFKGVVVGDERIFDLKKAYPNDAEIASLLKIDRAEVDAVSGNFKLTVKEVASFFESEMNQEFYDKVLGQDVAKTEEEFKSKIEEQIVFTLKQESDYRFVIDAREAMIDKIKGDLPSAFLKRWILATNEKVNQEQVDKDFPEFEKDLRWQLFKNKIVKENGLKVDEAEILESAKEFSAMQFRQYGIPNVPEEYLTDYALKMLERPDEKRRLADRKLEEKVIEYLKETIKLDDKEITREKFNKLFEK